MAGSVVIVRPKFLGVEQYCVKNSSCRRFVQNATFVAKNPNFAQI